MRDDIDPVSSESLYDQLTVYGPDHSRFEFRQVPAYITVEEIARAVFDQYPEPDWPPKTEQFGPPRSNDWVTVFTADGSSSFDLRHVPVRSTASDRIDSDILHLIYGKIWNVKYHGWDVSSRSVAVFFKFADGSLEAIELDESLNDARVRSGDDLLLTFKPALNGSTWLEVANFLESSAAAGIIGSAAYALLTSVVRSVASHKRKRDADRTDPVLSQTEATNIAEACICLKLSVGNPQTLEPVSVKRDTFGRRLEGWTVLIREDETNRIIEVRIEVPVAEPQRVRVDVKRFLP